jgi:hypothetical protein
MFINPELARARLDDPSNIVNRLLEIGLGPKPKVPSAAPAREDEKLESETPAELRGVGTDSSPFPFTSGVLGAESSEPGPRIKLRLGRNRTSPEVIEGESTVVNRNSHGRTKGATELAPFDRELLGTITKLDGPTAASEIFGVVPSTAFQAGQGNFKKDTGLSERVTRNLERVREVALDRLLSSVNLMEDDKMEGLSAKDLSAIASNLSRVVEKTLPKDLNVGPVAQLIVYAPTRVQEEYYKTVVLSR